jgi:hypothetical protein
MSNIVKVINIIIHLIIKYHHYATMGIEERTTGSVPKDFRHSIKLCAEGTTIPTRRIG